MTLGELIERTRSLLDDTNPSAYLWTDEDLISYANAAQREACRRADLLVDSTTPSLCRITVTAGTSSYTISPLIIKVTRAYLESDPLRVLIKLRSADLDRDVPGWSLATGRPAGYILERTNTIQLFPIPDANDTLRLQVVRYPLVDMVNETDIPEIAEQYHFGLIDWMCHLAYMKQDAETIDLTKSQTFQKFFNEKFGTRPSAMTETYRKSLPPNLSIQQVKFS